MFKTTDLLMAAVLSAENCEYIGSERNEGKVTFTFDDTEHLQKTKELFLRKELRMEPSLLFQQIRWLKNIVYNTQ